MTKDQEAHRILITWSNVVQRSGREDSYPSTYITVEEPGVEAHQDVIGGSESDNINEVEGLIQVIAYVVYYFLLVTAKHIQSLFSLVSPTPEPEGPFPIP